MGTMDSAVGSGSLTESMSLNVEARSSDTLNAVVSIVVLFQNNTPLCAEAA